MPEIYYDSPWQLLEKWEQKQLDKPMDRGHSTSCRDCLGYMGSTNRSFGGFPDGGLNIPESILFFVSPPACGRHADFSLMAGCMLDRFYRIRLTEQDLVNGSGAEKACRLICNFLEEMPKKPRVVLLCITCVDALLNTNYDWMADKLDRQFGIRFGIVKMFPLLAESARTHAELLIQTQFGLLRPTGHADKKKFVNIVGSVRPFSPESELVQVLGKAGYGVNHIRLCKTLEDYDAMGDAALNLVVVPHALPAAQMMQRKWGIPYIAFPETCSADTLLDNYRRLGEALGCVLDVKAYWQTTVELANRVCMLYEGKSIAVGNTFDFSPIKLARELASAGLPVKKVLTNKIRDYDREHLHWLAANRPDMKIGFGSQPEFFLQMNELKDMDLAIGLDYSMLLGCTKTRRLAAGQEPLDFYGLQLLLKKMEESCTAPAPAPQRSVEKTPYDRNWSVYRREWV